MVEAFEIRERLDQGFLGHLLSIIRVSEYPKTEVVDPALVSLDEFSGSRAVPSACSFDELGLVVRHPGA